MTFEVNKVTIHDVEWHLKVNLCRLESQKFEFGEVEKAMFQMVARHWELIFFLLSNPKYELN